MPAKGRNENLRPDTGQTRSRAGREREGRASDRKQPHPVDTTRAADRGRSGERDERQQPTLARRQSMPMPWWNQTPMTLLQRFRNEMDRLFDDFGFGSAGMMSPADRPTMWAPDVEVFQRGNEIVARVDLPGLTKDDVKVDISDDHITIQGERREDDEEEREGHYRSTRRYGRFFQSIPLPQGAITEDAKASFRNGVLEVTVPAPPKEVTRGRRIELNEASDREGKKR
jgi:HSP20 family protein